MTTEQQMWVTLGLLGIASILFIWGRVRADIVAIGALIVLIVTGILTPAEALSGFSSTVVIMMIGLFVVGGGIFQTGLAKMASHRLLRLAGTKETSLLIMVMLVTVVLGAFVSNTGTVAVLMPIVVSLAMKAGMHPGRLLMPMAFASSLGGTLTLIGTPPNLIIQDALTGAGLPKLSFFSFTPLGLVCVVTGVVAMLWLKRFLPANEEDGAGDTEKLTSDELVRRYQMMHNMFRVRVNSGSPLVVKKLAEVDISSRFEVNVIEIRRKLSLKNQFLKTVDQEVAGPGTVVQGGDILYVYGPYERVQQFADAYALTMLDQQVEERPAEAGGTSYVTDEVGVAELMLTPDSRLNHLPVGRSGFRERYRVNILGIKRKDQYLLHNLKDVTMRDDDIIFIQGKWKDIGQLAADQEDVVVIGQPLEESRKVTMDRKAPIAAGVMLLMVILLVTELIPAVAAIMISACLMVLLGCVRNMEEAYKTVNWGSVVLIGGMIPMSIAIEKTGAAALLSEGLVGSLGVYGPLALLAGTYFATSTMTLFLSNTTCAVLLAPIALSAALQMGVSPYPFLFAVAIGAGMCFAVPFSTPPNAMVMSAGRYKFTHYVKVGLPLQLIMGLVMMVAIPLIWPF